MMKDPVIIVDYEMGNIHSISKALRIYLPNVGYSQDPQELSQAQALVLPGDGAFPAAMASLDGALGEALLEFIRSGRPLLGICIGFQLLFENSEESFSKTEPKKSKGLALIPGHIKKFNFADQTRVPHMGWNCLLARTEINPTPILDLRLLHKKYFYFIHSYYASNVPSDFVLASCQYEGVVFPAVVQKENITATQFHPEKSGSPGLAIIEAWAQSIGS